MTIIATTSLPLALGAGEDLQDVVADVFPLYEGVQALTRMGVRVRIDLEPGEIVATLSLTDQAAAAGLLPVLIRELEDPGLIRAKTGAGLLVVGSMAQGNVTVRIELPDQYLSVAQALAADDFVALLTAKADDACPLCGYWTCRCGQGSIQGTGRRAA